MTKPCRCAPGSGRCGRCDQPAKRRKPLTDSQVLRLLTANMPEWPERVDVNADGEGDASDD